MPRTCSICNHERRQEIDRKLRAGVTFQDISRWLADIDKPAGRMAVSRHAAHLGIGPRTPGPRPISGDFLKDVVEIAHTDLSEGVLRPSLRDALTAQVAIDNRANRQSDAAFLWQLGQILGGAAVFPVIEGESRRLTAWDKEMEAEAATDEARMAVLVAGETLLPE